MASSKVTGLVSRAMRPAMNSVAPRPLRRSPSMVAGFANPPTKKKIGITCRSQVAVQRYGTSAITLPVWNSWPRQTTTAISQCPSTTTAIEKSRRKST